jgi:hypothetical protein
MSDTPVLLTALAASRRTFETALENYRSEVIEIVLREGVP